jgi:uncharacterized protein
MDFGRACAVVLIVTALGIPQQSTAGEYNDAVAAYDRGDYATSFRMHSDMADRGHAGAQTFLGMLYEAGRGVDKDEAEAVRWYRKAAEQGYPGAQTNLGFMYEHGSGVANDDAEAVRWYRKAALQGDARAMTNLGLMVEGGRGAEASEAEALHWYVKAMRLGDARAHRRVLAIEHKRGCSENAFLCVLPEWFVFMIRQY